MDGKETVYITAAGKHFEPAVKTMVKCYPNRVIALMSKDNGYEKYAEQTLGILAYTGYYADMPFVSENIDRSEFQSKEGLLINQDGLKDALRGCITVKDITDCRVEDVLDAILSLVENCPEGTNYVFNVVNGSPTAMAGICLAAAVLKGPLYYPLKATNGTPDNTVVELVIPNDHLSVDEQVKKLYILKQLLVYEQIRDLNSDDFRLPDRLKDNIFVRGALAPYSEAYNVSPVGGTAKRSISLHRSDYADDVTELSQSNLLVKIKDGKKNAIRLTPLGRTVAAKEFPGGSDYKILFFDGDEVDEGMTELAERYLKDKKPEIDLDDSDPLYIFFATEKVRTEQSGYRLIVDEHEKDESKPHVVAIVEGTEDENNSREVIDSFEKEFGVKVDIRYVSGAQESDTFTELQKVFEDYRVVSRFDYGGSDRNNKILRETYINISDGRRYMTPAATMMANIVSAKLILPDFSIRGSPLYVFNTRVLTHSAILENKYRYLLRRILRYHDILGVWPTEDKLWNVPSRHISVGVSKSFNIGDVRFTKTGKNSIRSHIIELSRTREEVLRDFNALKGKCDETDTAFKILERDAKAAEKDEWVKLAEIDEDGKVTLTKEGKITARFITDIPDRQLFFDVEHPDKSEYPDD